MACCGNGAPTTRAALTTNADTALSEGMVRLEYTGRNEGSIPFRVNGVVYRGGRHAAHRYADAPPEDARQLITMGMWREVRVVEPTKQPDNTGGDQQPDNDQQPGTPLPEALDQRVREALAAAGYTSVEEVRDADDETLLAVEGIGKATLAKVREATA